MSDGQISTCTPSSTTLSGGSLKKAVARIAFLLLPRGHSVVLRHDHGLKYEAGLSAAHVNPDLAVRK